MPVFQKQVPPKAPVKAIAQPNNVGTVGAEPGSILATAVPVTSIVEQWLKVCFYGRNRSGKTTLACQFPKPLLLVSYEPSETGGAISVSKMAGVSIIRISHKPLLLPNGKLEEHYGTVKSSMLAQELHKHCPFKTVVLDTATSLQDLILQEIMNLSAIPEMLTWGMISEDQYRDRSSRTREALRPFLDLPCHVIVNAQEKDHNPPKERGVSKLVRGMQGESFMAADLGGATVKWLHDCVGYIGQLYEDEVVEQRKSQQQVGNETHEFTEEVRTGRRTRRLRTLYHPNFAAGARSATPSAVPEYIEANSPEEMYQKFMLMVQGIKIKDAKYL